MDRNQNLSSFASIRLLFCMIASLGVVGCADRIDTTIYSLNYYAEHPVLLKKQMSLCQPSSTDNAIDCNTIRELFEQYKNIEEDYREYLSQWEQFNFFLVGEPRDFAKQELAILSKLYKLKKENESQVSQQ